MALGPTRIVVPTKYAGFVFIFLAEWFRLHRVCQVTLQLTQEAGLYQLSYHRCI